MSGIPSLSQNIGSALASAGLDLGRKGAQLLGQAMPGINFAAGRYSEILNERPELLKDLRLSESMIDSAQEIAKHASKSGLKLCSVNQLLKNVYTIRNRIQRYLKENALQKSGSTPKVEDKTAKGLTEKAKKAAEKAAEWNNYIWPLFYRQHLAMALSVFQASFMVYQAELQTINTELALLPTLDEKAKADLLKKINAKCAANADKAEKEEDVYETSGGAPGGPDFTEKRPRRSTRLAARA